VRRKLFYCGLRQPFIFVVLLLSLCSPSLFAAYFPAGLSHWWKGEGDTVDQVGGIDGIPAGGVFALNAKIGRGFLFDGVSGTVILPRTSVVSGSNYTVAAWVKPLTQVSDPDGQDLIFGQAFGQGILAVRPGGAGLKVVWEYAENLFSFPSAISTREIPIGDFSFLVGTWDGSRLKLYINGNLESEVVTTVPATNPNCLFYIGGFSDACGYTRQFFDGIIDEVTTFNRALSPSEIQGMYGSGIVEVLTPPENQPSTSDSFSLLTGTRVVSNSGVQLEASNLFDGLIPAAPETGNTIFSDSKPPGFIHFIEWVTGSPIALRSLSLFASGDSSASNFQREFARFTLKAKPAGSTNYDLVLADFIPTHPYTFVDSNTFLLLKADINATSAQSFRAEFLQYTAGRGFDGPRIMELDGFGLPDPFFDGIPVSWREQYFGGNFSTNSQANALGDPDGDGASNFQEFLAGTNPTDAASVRALALLTVNPPGGSFSSSAQVGAASLVTNSVIRYTVDGSEPVAGSVAFPSQLSISKTSTLKARVFVGDKAVSDIVTAVFTINLPGFPSISQISDQTTVMSQPTQPIAILLFDPDSSATDLRLSATSDNPTLVPVDHLVFSGTGASRQLVIAPLAGQLGSARITIVVTDPDGLTASSSFQLKVLSTPTISVVPTQVLSINGASGPLPVTVNDIETGPENLTLSAKSSNPVLLPEANIVLGGSGRNRTISITPSRDSSGTATIVLTVMDADGLSASSSFTVQVSNTNTAPVISIIPDQVTDEDMISSRIEFTVQDAETSVSRLRVTLLSSNPTLLPIGNMLLAGSDSARSLILVPAPNESGQATVTVAVDDGEVTSSRSFLFTVNPVNDPPVIGPFPEITIPFNGQSGPIAVLVTDLESAPDKIEIKVAAEDTVLLPKAGLLLTGVGNDRQLRIQPGSGQSGHTSVTVTATDESGLSAERNISVTVEAPVVQAPAIVLQPHSLTVTNGEPANFIVEATGTEPLRFQWFHNGNSVAEATSKELRIGSAQSTDGGTYFVRVSNTAGSVDSASATLTVTAPTPSNDAFLNAATISGTRIVTAASNLKATLEPNEPQHAGRPGGASVWWNWTAPFSGKASVSTAGSNFDTLLAVYLGDRLTELALTAQNDDDPKGGSTSLCEFQCQAGKTYRIAVDGFAGEAGTIALNLLLLPNAPRVGVERSGANILVSWSTTGPVFQLESSGTISGDQWAPVKALPVQASDRFIVKLGSLSTQQFFRLRMVTP